jgi:hypothetical protein
LEKSGWRTKFGEVIVKAFIQIALNRDGFICKSMDLRWAWELVSSARS